MLYLVARTFLPDCSISMHFDSLEVKCILWISISKPCTQMMPGCFGRDTKEFGRNGGIKAEKPGDIHDALLSLPRWDDARSNDANGRREDFKLGKIGKLGYTISIEDCWQDAA